jgi:hypothetical protein
MPDIVFPVSSAPGRRPLEGQGRLINCLTETLQQGGQSLYARRPAPGLRICVDTTEDGVCRGGIVVQGVLILCINDRCIKIEQSGATYTATDLGELPGEGPVFFAANNAAPPPDIVATTSVGAYNIFTDSAPTSFADGDLPQPNSVTFLDGYLIFSIADGRLFASGLNAVTINPLDFTTAQARPGGIYRAIAFGQQLYAFGPSSIEVYANTANAEGFPFSRVSVIPVGLLTAGAIAGYEDGWGASLLWVGDDRAVYRLDGGYVPSKVSTPDIDRDLQSVADIADLHALVFEHPGHTCWAIIGPNFAWVYDLTTGFWHERESYLRPTWDAKFSARFNGEWIVGHASNGVVYRIDDEYRKEGTQPLVMTLRSGQNAAFPNRIAIPRADFNFVVGQGIGNGEEPIETEPRCWISYSKDGGNLFSTPVWRELGRQGEYRNRVTINRCGLTGPMGVVWEVSISDPIYVTLLSATMEVDARPR